MDDLGPQERAVLDCVAANPFVGQQEIATALGLARSTVATHIAQLMQKGYVLGRAYALPQPRRIVCLGGATVDRTYRAAGRLIRATSNPVEGRRGFGGVARNVAENLARLGVAVSLATIVGDDDSGRAVMRHLRDLGVDMALSLTTTERPTAEYAAILEPGGDLAFGIADMGVFDLLSPAHVDRIWPHVAAAAFVFVDCNLPVETLATLTARRRGARFRLAIDAVSLPKAQRLPADLAGVDVLFLNRDEAASLVGDDLSPAVAAAALRARGADQVVVTLGHEGCVVASARGVDHVPPIPARPVDVTGAGDAMIAGMLYRMLAGERAADAARAGAALAAITTESASTVRPDLSARLLAEAMRRATETIA